MLSKDGKRAVTFTKGDSLEIHDLEDAGHLGRSLTGEAIHEVAMDPSGRWFATHSDFDRITLWDNEQKHYMLRLGDRVHRLVFDESGRHLLTIIRNGIVRILPVCTDLLTILEEFNGPRALSSEEKLFHDIPLDPIEEAARNWIRKELNNDRYQMISFLWFMRFCEDEGRNIPPYYHINEPELKRKIQSILEFRFPRGHELFRDGWAMTLTSNRTTHKFNSNLSKAYTLDCRNNTCRIDYIKETYQQALGAEHHRCGEYKKAIKKLMPFLKFDTEAAEIPPDPEGGRLVPFIFTTLARQALGDEKKTAVAIENLNRAVDEAFWAGELNPRYLKLLREVWSEESSPVIRIDDGTSIEESASHIPPFLFRVMENNGKHESLRLFSGSKTDCPVILDSKNLELPTVAYSRRDRSLYFIEPDPEVSGVMGDSERRLGLYRVSIMQASETPGTLPERVCSFRSSRSLDVAGMHPNLPVVYVTVHARESSRMSSVYCATLVEGAEVPLRPILGGPDHFFSKPVVSPDGEYMLFIHGNGINRFRDRHLLTARLSPDGTTISNPKLLFLNGDIETFCLPPFLGDEALVVLDDPRGSGAIYRSTPFRHDASLSVRPRIHFALEGFPVMGSTYHPDGYFAITCEEEGREFIRVIQPSGRQVMTLTGADLSIEGSLITFRFPGE